MSLVPAHDSDAVDARIEAAQRKLNKDAARSRLQWRGVETFPLDPGVAQREFTDEQRVLRMPSKPGRRWRAVAKFDERIEALMREQEKLNQEAATLREHFVLAHPVLSQSAHWQLEQFILNVARVLRPAGRILASIRLAEGNPKKVRERRIDRTRWTRSGSTRPPLFQVRDVARTAARHGLTVAVNPEYTERFIARRPREIDDWLMMS
jgi:hypothetical protein